jgi:hypothetical protein
MISMELTEDELIYTFNCISVHGMKVEEELKELRKKINNKPSVFFESISTLKTILNDLVTGYEIQLKILPKIESVDNEGVIKKTLEQSLKRVVSHKLDLDEVLRKLDEDEDEDEDE